MGFFRWPVPSAVSTDLGDAMRIILLILGLLLALPPVSAAELALRGQPQRDDFVTVESDQPGQFVVIGPTSITVKQTAEAEGVKVGESSINFRRVILADGGKVAHFVGPPGTYAVIQFVPEESEPSHLVVTIPGTVDEDDDPPDPIPGVLKRIVVVYESARPPEQELLTAIRKYDKHPLTIVDQDQTSDSLKPAVEAAQAKGIPAVVFVGDGGRVLSVVKLPNSYQGFVEAVGRVKRE